MGVLTALFGGKSGLAREIKFNSTNCRTLWENHIAKYETRHEISRFFRYDRVESAMDDLEKLQGILNTLKILISKDITGIGNEERAENTIVKDLDELYRYDIEFLNESIAGKISDEYSRQKGLLELLRKIHEILKLELHYIKKINEKIEIFSSLKNNQGNKKEKLKLEISNLIRGLFKLIFHIEYHYYTVFLRVSFMTKKKYDSVQELTAKILIGSKLEKIIRTEEEVFIELAMKSIQDIKRVSYRRLAEDVYMAICDIVRDEDDGAGIESKLKKLGKHIRDKILVEKLIVQNKGRLKLTNEQVSLLAEIFVKCHDVGDFVDLEIALSD